jgi:hypothetical protein
MSQADVDAFGLQAETPAAPQMERNVIADGCHVEGPTGRAGIAQGRTLLRVVARVLPVV